MSPYLDPAPLARMSTARSLRVIIPSNKEQRRTYNARELARWREHLFHLQANDEDEVFSHAKLYIFTFAKGGGLLAAGSANCTPTGLLRLAGQGRAEMLVLFKLNRSQATALKHGFRLRPLINELDDSSLEEDASPTPPLGLLAWGHRGGSGRLEVWTPPGFVASEGAQLLKSGVSAVLLALRPASEGCYEQEIENPDWRNALDVGLRDGEWVVRWQNLEGCVTDLSEGETRAVDDLASLWGGGRELLPGIGIDGQPGSEHPEGNESGRAENHGALLDEYERRSDRVCRNLRRELKSNMPSGLGRFQRVWETEPTLGVAMEQDVVPGLRLFLATRLLAGLRASTDLPSEMESWRMELTSQWRVLRNTLLPKGMHRDFSAWTRPAEWPEHPRKRRTR